MTNNKLILLSILTLAFSNPLKGLYVSYDATATAAIDVLGINAEVDYDSGALAVWYDFPVANNIAIGASFDLIKMQGDGSDAGDGFLNIYGKYTFPINPMFSAWAIGGYNLPQGDVDEFDGGISYGAGVKMNNGIGVSYVIHNISMSESVDGVSLSMDATISRLTLSYSF